MFVGFEVVFIVLKCVLSIISAYFAQDIKIKQKHSNINNNFDLL